MKNILLSLMLFFSFALPVHAGEKVAGSAAQLKVHQETIDPRTKQLEAYLAKYNPELAKYADIFVQQADKYSLDWSLVAAIAGLESTFCKRIPAGSYNCWGWGIPTGAKSGIGFTSYAHGIETVSLGLRTRYVDRGLLTVEEMGRVYAASPTWASRVRYFMRQIEDGERTGILAYAPTLSN